jgi:TolA-binding protein
MFFFALTLKPVIFDLNFYYMSETKPKSFWSKPEGVTGAVILMMLLFAGGYLAMSFLGAILSFLSTTIGLITALLTLGVLIYMVLDPSTRTLVSFMYKSAMRWITGLFVEIDPIGILKSYVQDLKTNLTKMNRQIGQLRGQMHKLNEMIINNKKEIDTNLNQASQAASSNQQAQMLLKSRKAGRLQESNVKLEDLYKKMEILYRVLAKMYENSEILVEDITDQVMVKEQERKAILASTSAMRSAMSVIKGDPDKKAMFDAALEAVADDVSKKVGEIERFMEVSQGFMQSIDLQNGVFEEEGLKMLEKWEAESTSLLLGGEKEDIIHRANDAADVLDLNAPISHPEKVGRTNQYDNLFE